jgi:hypothetical protein
VGKGKSAAVPLIRVCGFCRRVRKGAEEEDVINWARRGLKLADALADALILSRLVTQTGKINVRNGCDIPPPLAPPPGGVG